MIKMRRSAVIAGFFALLLFWGFPAAYAQQSKTIALHPLQGEPEDIARIFFDELVKALPYPWIPYEISLDNKKAVTIDAAAFEAVVSELAVIETGNIEGSDTVSGTISLSNDAANVQDVSLQLYTLGDSGQLITEGQPIKPNSSGNFSINGLASGKSYFILTVLLPNYKPELTPLIPGMPVMDPIVLQYQEIESAAVEPDNSEPDESDRLNWLQNYGIILPAFMCPAASLTNNAPYAFTGEVSEIVPGVYRLRLYLWDMKYRVQLVSDEMIAEDGEDCAQNLPLLLSWMLSSTNREIFVELIEKEVAVGVAEPADTGHWLTMGLRIGGGDAIWYYSIEEDWVLKKYVTDFPSVNVSFQMALHILPWLALQPEVNLNVDASPPWETDISSDEATIFSYLTFPVLLKFNWRNNKLAASIFAGAYYYMPLTLPFNQTENVSPSNLFEYTPKPPGLVFGGSIGWKLGAGYLFIDGRFEYDGFLLDDPSPNQTYYRNMARLSIGYEIGLFKKRARPAAARETRQNTRQQAETAPLVREAGIQPDEL